MVLVYNREKSSNNVVLVGRGDFHHRTWRRLWTPVAAAAKLLQSTKTKDKRAVKVILKHIDL